MSVVLRNVNPLGFVDVPILRREGPAPYLAPCEKCDPDHPDLLDDDRHTHDEVVDAEHGEPGSGCLVPNEEFETTPEIAGYPPAEDGSHPGAGLLAQVGNYEHVSGELLTPPGGPVVELPEGDPTDKWKNAQLEKYAQIHGIDVESATTKAELLAAITKEG